MNHALSLKSVLFAMDGVSFITTLDGVFALMKPESSNMLPHLDVPADLTSGELVGRSLFDFVTSDATREYYTAVFESLKSGRKARINFSFRDDSPSIERHCLSSISTLQQEGQLVGCLHQVMVTSEKPRRLMQIFREDKQFRPGSDQDVEMILPLCSFCHRVEIVGEFDRKIWISCEDYYMRGGAEDVLIDKMVCPSCQKSLLNKT